MQCQRNMIILKATWLGRCPVYLHDLNPTGTGEDERLTDTAKEELVKHLRRAPLLIEMT